MMESLRCHAAFAECHLAAPVLPVSLFSKMQCIQSGHIICLQCIDNKNNGLAMYFIGSQNVQLGNPIRAV